MFEAILLEQDDRRTLASVRTLDDSALPDGEVTVAVEYSTLNYKDALAITGKSPVVRKWPMVPGIDLAGTVEHSQDTRFRQGDKVILNGWGAGETRWGGLAQRARVPGDFLLDLPPALSTRQAMAIGTAGYTAMLCVQALAHHGVTPGDGEVLVTGANGGVGGFAIAILARRGYRVVASTGRLDATARLNTLGAGEVIDRKLLSDKGKPLQRERWAGVVDSVGGHTLANACAALRYGGVVAACGLAQNMDLPASVAPFILRGVTLAGIDSVYAPVERRRAAWERLATELDAETIARVADEELSLVRAVELAGELIDGKVEGRIIVNPNT